MEGWVKIGVQRGSVLYPNLCYNEPCYIEVQVYYGLSASVADETLAKVRGLSPHTGGQTIV